MKKIVFLLSCDQLGFTFLSWSLHYLSGHNSSFSVDQNKFIDLPDNPLMGNNAHRFVKNNPHGFTQTIEFIDKVNTVDFTGFQTIYAILADIEQLFPHLSVSEITENINTLISEQHADTAKLFDLCSASGPTIVAEIPKNNKTFQLNIRSLEKKVFENVPYADEESAIEHFNTLFFNESLEKYKALANFDIWDKREFLALNSRILTNNYELKIDKSKQHFYIHVSDLWFNLDESIRDIFKYIDEQIDEQRYTSWLPIYKRWSMNMKRLDKFEWYIDHIVECIVNNWYFDLSALNLTLIQEAAIQHLLMYKHNLTIKNWQLVKFPNNTQDIHKLLERNFHELKAY
jgi:hypothetical protein